MRKIINYSLVCYEDIHDLDEHVSNWVMNGWEPLGAPIVRGLVLIQAMVKYESEVEYRKRLTKEDIMYRGKRFRTW
jgi:hypothetical protein